MVAEYKRLQRLYTETPALNRHEPALKASVPGPYTLSGRLLPNRQYQDRWALTEALLPLVRKELEDLVAAGCREISVDEPSMSCYAHREDPTRFADIFNRTVEPVGGKTRLCTHLCFGNYKARAVGPRRLAPMFPTFLEFQCDEMHLEMASREFAEIEIIAEISRRMVFDQGSIAATWVNFNPVSNQGIVLTHGDLIHIGRSGFRFSIQNPERSQKNSRNSEQAIHSSVEKSPADRDQGITP